MKKFFLTLTFLSLGFVSLGFSQEAPTTTPVEKKPAAQPQANPASAPAAPVQPAASKPAGPKKYVIKSGDNPWTIARDHGVSHEALLKANDIEDPKNLKIGDVLVLPEGVASKNAPKPKGDTKPAAAPGPQSGDGWELYTIQSGDNPWTIAKKLKVDHQKILSLNEGLNFRDLKIGQQIKVPKKS